jgi:hypothetical protein
MNTLTKRRLLVALAAIGAGGAGLADAALAQAVCTPLELAGGRDIGAAWRAANPDADLDALRGELLPDGACEEALAGLAERVRDDFHSGAIFVYRGWRLSETEARLFALAAGS